MQKIRHPNFGKIAAAALFMTVAAVGAAQEDLVERFSGLTKGSNWGLVSSGQLDFTTFHTQGMTRVGDSFFLSSVDIIERTERYDTPQDGFDRTPGTGRGLVFKMNMAGELEETIELGDGDMYHPGGIDFDGEYVWVPVAEYRPDSESIIYRIHAETLEVTEVFRFPDHIGGIVHDTETGKLHGVSWGSRRLYSWNLDDSLNVTDTAAEPVANKQHYIDYQDCQYVGNSQMLCSGLAGYPGFTLGGIELVDLTIDTPVFQLPVLLATEAGRPMTQNPFYVETADAGLRAYFVPEDDTSHLFVYEIAVR